jgi:polar amino acid transport system ATP-binding protein
VIKTVDLKKTFIGRGQIVHAVDGITTHIKAGEVVVVIGPSGSGKSTYLRCLNGLEELTSGHIHIDGVDLADRKTDLNKIRREVGMVFQQFNLFPHKTVLENLVLAQTVVRKENAPRRKQRRGPCCRRWVSAKKRWNTRSASPADSNSALPLPGPWQWIPR